MKRPGWVVSGVLAAAMGLAAAGCGSSTPGSAGSTTAPTTSTTQPVATTRLMPTTATGQPGPVVTVPTESGTRPISQAFDVGQQILIEPAAFWPNILVAQIKIPITWTNLTTSPQQISFLVSSVKSPVIPPGGKWSYTPENGANIHYVDPALHLQSTVDFNGS